MNIPVYFLLLITHVCCLFVTQEFVLALLLLYILSIFNAINPFSTWIDLVFFNLLVLVVFIIETLSL